MATKPATGPVRGPTDRKAAAFFALLFTAIYLAPGISHVASLSHKIDMGQQDYYSAQQAYGGWALFSIALALAVAANLWLALANRRHGISAALPIASVVLLLAGLAVFFVWVYPANAATQNWFSVPTNWPSWRRQWEYGHAMSAVLSLAAFCSTALTAVDARR